MSPLRKAYYILRYLGPRFVWLRGRVVLGKKLGTGRRTFRARPWETINLAEIAHPGTPTEPQAYANFKRAQPPAFLFPLGKPPEVPAAIRDAPGERRPSLTERLCLLAEDRCVYFFRTPSPEPIDWYANPLHGARSTPGPVWCDVPDFLPEQGDVRTMWEPARAAWALDLARARSHGIDADAGSLFWRWVDSWMNACPPFTGVQWKCGQESSVRLIAIALGFWSLADDPATTPQRWVQFARLAWATGYRVAHHIRYAISQKNNHATSEACGLLLVSRLFPEFRESSYWQALGRRVLAQELRRQTYADGSYLQHSMNYHRVMLHGGLLGLRLAELAGQPFKRDLYERLGRCGEFLFQMMEPETGRLPQYGANDGANVLPLSECDFNDYRPVIQAVHCLAHRERVLPAGPWDEDLLWLFGPEALAKPEPAARQPVSTAFEVGGYYTLRREHSWAMLRCHTYRDRPGDCDPLHLDLWWRGRSVLQDCGSYCYYIPDRPDLEHYFKSIAAHNTVELDGRDPYERVSRFLTFPWPRARKRHYRGSGAGVLSVEGEHAMYDRRPWGVLHRRLVLGLPDDLWVVVDDLLGEGQHRAALRWHMLDAPYEIEVAGGSVRLKTDRGDVWVCVTGRPHSAQQFEVVRGRDEPGRVQGFAAPYYSERVPIPTLEVAFHGALPQRIITTISAQQAAELEFHERRADGDCWILGAPAGAWTLVLAPPERSAPAILVRCKGLGSRAAGRR